jgi:hypothetical protein
MRTDLGTWITAEVVASAQAQGRNAQQAKLAIRAAGNAETITWLFRCVGALPRSSRASR